jgi:hypothetical protein
MLFIHAFVKSFAREKHWKMRLKLNNRQTNFFYFILIELEGYYIIYACHYVD